jgi:hypothetical protein
MTDPLAQLFGENPNAADIHKPSNRREYAAAARDLIGRGYTTDDCARALGITRRGVLDLLAEGFGDVLPKYRSQVPR